MMLFLSVLKDIFWSNQFAPADGQRLDRDRYLLGFTALYALANALNVGARLLYPDSADFLYDGETPAVRLMWLLMVAALLFIIMSSVCCGSSSGSDGRPIAAVTKSSRIRPITDDNRLLFHNEFLADNKIKSKKNPGG